MGISGGIFWGYRELDIKLIHKIRLSPPSAALSPPQVTAIEVEMLDTPTYDYKVFSGYAEDEYPEELTQVGFMSRMVIITVRGNPLDIEYSYDGETIGGGEILRHSHRAVKAVRAFRLRNVVPRWRSWYQVYLSQ